MPFSNNSGAITWSMQSFINECCFYVGLIGFVSWLNECNVGLFLEHSDELNKLIAFSLKREINACRFNFK